MQGEEQTAELRLEQLMEIIAYFEADKAAIESEQWQRIEQVIRLRRATLLQALVNSDDEGSREIRTKGRIQEIDYLLGFMERLERGVASAQAEIEEMEKFIAVQKIEEQADREGIER